MSPQELEAKILALRSAISALDSRSRSLDHWLMFFTFMVLVGVALEIAEVAVEHLEEVHDWKWKVSWLPDKPKHWLFGIEYLAIILVVGGVGGELGANFIASYVNNELRIKNEKLVKLVEMKVGFVGIKAEDAQTSSHNAALDAEKAKGDATEAHDMALGARKEADSFAADITSAKTQAAKAESDLADALRQAVEAQVELNKVKSPRTLTDVSGLIDALAEFKDTEYTFSGVFEDEESIDLLRQIDSALKLAGWKRIKPKAGFPSINVYGSNEDFAVTAALTNGLVISIDWPDGLSPELQSLPQDKLPDFIKKSRLPKGDPLFTHHPGRR